MTEKEKITVTEIADIAKGLTNDSKEALLRFGQDLILIDRVKANAGR